MADCGNKHLTIIYYRHFDDVQHHIQTELSDTEALLFCDLDDRAGFSPLLSVEDQDYERACVEIAERIDSCDTAVEKALVYEYLQAHYPRLTRYFGAFAKAQQSQLICFINATKYNVFDAAFHFFGQSRFYDLIDNKLRPIDPGTLVSSYCKQPLATDRITLADDILATIKAQHFVPQYYDDLEYDNQTFILEAKAQWREFCLHNNMTQRQTEAKATLFIAATNEYDLYLKPLYPVWREMDKRAMPYRILSCNALTDSILEKHGLIHQPSMTRLASTAYPVKGALLLGALLNFADRPLNHLIDYLLMLALNSAFLPSLLSRLIQCKEVAKQHYEHAHQVFYAPDGTPDAFYLDLFKPPKCHSYTLVAAAITNRYNTIVRYMAETIFCYGRQCQRTIEHFFSDKQTVLSGNPSLYVYRQNALDHPYTQRPYALIATSRFDPSESQWIKALLQQVDADKLLLLIKPHPFFKDSYQQYEPLLNGHVLLAPQQNIDRYVGASRFVITDHSQVGRDAHLLGKPVISMSLVAQAPYLADVESVVVCDTIDKLIAQVNYFAQSAQACQGAVSDKFIDDYNYGGTAQHYLVVVDTLAAKREGHRTAKTA